MYHATNPFKVCDSGVFSTFTEVATLTAVYFRNIFLTPNGASYPLAVTPCWRQLSAYFLCLCICLFPLSGGI